MRTINLTRIVVQQTQPRVDLPPRKSALMNMPLTIHRVLRLSLSN